MNQTSIKLPCLVSDGMVLQRNTQVKIWGWAPAGDSITISFINKVYKATVNKNGEWSVSVETENAGGPYQMDIETEKAGEKITIKNILLGDVWLCSGQSNMEMKMESVQDTYPEEVSRASNNFIRQFLVPVKYDFKKPHADYESGCWQAANSQNILNFTAAGYFFALKLYEKYKVPIGLLNASLGGSPLEAWLSEEGLTPFADCFNAAKKLRDEAYLNTLLEEDQASMNRWYSYINQNDQGLKNNQELYHAAGYDTSSWGSIKVPSYWEDEGLGHFNGVVWFKKEIEIPADLSGKSAKLFLGNIADEDTVYINGTMAGTTPNQYIPRKYNIPEGLLKAGKNTIVIRVVNGSGRGGFYKDKPYELKMENKSFELSGEWKYQIGVKTDPMPAPAFIQWRPMGLFNCMIAPAINYAIKGVIWYQGESNTGKPEEYESLLRALITDWRKQWKQGDFPFLYVQLPNFMEASDKPSESNWAVLREAQRRTLALPGTGMAVAIDLGEWNDIHPVNKKDVGGRLALAAQRVAYGDNSVVTSGPMLQSVEKDGNRLILSFSDTGSGLIIRDGVRLKHFAISGADKVFVWADATIESDKVVVWNDQVTEPVYVRYAWADNPESANLYNREGLPASPFTTE